MNIVIQRVNINDDNLINLLYNDYMTIHNITIALRKVYRNLDILNFL